MRNLIILSFISLSLINCKQGGGGPATSLPANDGSCQTCETNISTNINDIGAKARNLIDNDSIINEMFYNLNEFGERVYNDISILSATRAYVHHRFDSSNPIEMCNELSDYYTDLQITNHVIELSADQTIYFTGGTSYCFVEIQAEKLTYIADPVMNSFYFLDNSYPMSYSLLVDTISNNELDRVSLTPYGNNYHGFDTENYVGHYSFILRDEFELIDGNGFLSLNNPNISNETLEKFEEFMNINFSIVE